MAVELGRVTDPEALDEAKGARAKMGISVPQTWLLEGADLSVIAPKLLACQRCEGGGCDSCERSGALSAPRPEERRTLRLSLPGGSGKGVLIRLVDPFGDAIITQLFVRVQVGDAPSAGVSKHMPLRSLVPQTLIEQWEKHWQEVAMAVLLIVALTILTLIVIGS